MAQVASAATETPTLSEGNLRDMAGITAVAYNIDPVLFLKVINCESGWNIKAKGKLGENGLVQIYPKAWPDISEEQADNPVFALNFLAANMAEGKGYYWTCWRKYEIN